MVVLFVYLEMIGKVSYSLAQKGDLNFGGTCVLLVELKLINNLFLDLWSQNHFLTLLLNGFMFERTNKLINDSKHLVSVEHPHDL